MRASRGENCSDVYSTVQRVKHKRSFSQEPLSWNIWPGLCLPDTGHLTVLRALPEHTRRPDLVTTRVLTWLTSHAVTFPTSLLTSAPSSGYSCVSLTQISSLRDQTKTLAASRIFAFIAFITKPLEFQPGSHHDKDRWVDTGAGAILVLQ